MLGLLYEFADGIRHQARRRRWPAGQALGRRGEDIAHRFLQRAGIIVVARNYRLASGAGEIDLVGWDHDTLVFAEVKSRTTDEFGAPDRAIDAEKRQRMLRAARDFARHAEVPWEKVRFDIVSVVFTTPPAVTHFRDVMKP
ncbi:MAG: YraN family protein [Bryobacteraceae bacterium]|jgi:putative endonuclease